MFRFLFRLLFLILQYLLVQLFLLIFLNLNFPQNCLQALYLYFLDPLKFSQLRIQFRYQIILLVLFLSVLFLYVLKTPVFYFPPLLNCFLAYSVVFFLNFLQLIQYLIQNFYYTQIFLLFVLLYPLLLTSVFLNTLCFLSNLLISYLLSCSLFQFLVLASL